MEPWTISLIGGTAFWLIDKYRDAKKNAPKKLDEPSPRSFTVAQAALFTRQDGESRVWDKDVALKLEAMLRCRSAVPMPATSDLSRIGRAWMVVPMQPGAWLASDVLAQAAKDKQVVLGSLSLLGLWSGSLEPMALVVCPPGGEQYTRATPQGASHFAVIAPPIVVVAPAVPPQAPAPEVQKVAASVVEAPAKKAPVNGAAKKESAPVTVVHAEVPQGPES